MNLFYFVQTSYFGRLVYKWSNYKYFKYPEDAPDYEIPKEYLEKGDIIIEWDKEKDPHYPRNWPFICKVAIQLQMAMLTTFAYLSGPIYSPAAETVMEEFGISYTLSTFPLAFFILGYGFSQMFLSPLLEIPMYGRTIIYFYTGFVYTLLQIPCALTNNIAGLTITRFIAGMFVSPPLSIGVASFTDVLKMEYLPIGLAVWGMAGLLSPAIGPIMGSGLLLKSWRDIFWFLMAINGFMTVFLFIFSPETNESTVLYWRAERLRRITGNKNIKIQYELNSTSTYKLLSTITWRAFEIMILEPMVFLIDILLGLVYGCIYLWFESFPIVFTETFHFSSAATSVCYISIIVGVFLGLCVYCWHVNQSFTKKLQAGKQIQPELFLPCGVIGFGLIVIALFIFGWTANADYHWIGPVIGATLFGIGAILAFQSQFNYLAMCFPEYVASVFGGNGLFRSLIGGTFPMYGRAMFNNLSIKNFPVAWGSSLLAFIFLILLPVPLIFYIYGPKLRKRSKYASA